MKRALAALALLLPGCPSTDTLLGLDATIAEATIVVVGSDVAADVSVDYRNGAHTDGARMFQPQRIELFAGDAPVAQLSVDIPPDTALTLEPGASASATFTGDGTAADASPLCDGARVLFRWLDGTTGEPGFVEADADSVTCD